MWIFDYYSSSEIQVKDIVEIADYELTIDEETNANSTIKVLKKTNAKAKDIIAVKKNNERIYWGIIEEIQNESGANSYTFITKYITNLFDREIPLEAVGTKKSFVAKILNSGNGLQLTLMNTLLVSSSTTASYFHFIYTPNGYYIERNGRYLTYNLSTNAVTAVTFTGSANQLWQISGTGTQRKIQASNNKYLTLGSLGSFTITIASTQVLYTNTELSTNEIIQKAGIEDQILNAIQNNFTNSGDSLLNIDYITFFLTSNLHNTKQTQVTNVENGIYNLHTWLTNCTQYYNVVYGFNIVNKKLSIGLGIPNIALIQKELIDSNAQNISNYTEVFETDVTAKVMVLYDKVNGQDNKGVYTLFLKTDRTTTTDETDQDRAEGNVTTIYTENYEDANQSALDVMKGNEYNHSITFNYDKYIAIGTPIAIKTKNSIIYNSYISSIKTTQNKFYEYICGNIRINFIDKLLKEKKNA